VYHQEEIHDRVWLKDETDAVVVGTSFNGLGNKCAFLLNLEAADASSFSAELRRIRSATRSATRSNEAINTDA
jgi:hypothetical protein